MLGTALAKTFAHVKPTVLSHSDIDITNHDQVLEKLTALKPSTIINAAAYTAVDDCEIKRDIAMLVNGTAPGYLAEVAKQVGATLVHYSTDYVFAGDSAEGYDEAAPVTLPVNVYGESKAAGERAIAAQADANWSDWFVIRTAWLYGANGKNFVDTILKLAATKPELAVVDDQHGSPTYTADLSEQTNVLLTGSYANGIYHVTNSGQCTWYDFAKTAVTLSGGTTLVKPCTSADFPRPAKRPAYSVLLNTKLPALRPWQEALAAYLQNR